MTGVLQPTNVLQFWPSYLECVLRHERLDRDHIASSDRAVVTTMGVNIMLEQNVKFQANYRLADDKLNLVHNTLMFQLQAVLGI